MGEQVGRFSFIYDLHGNVIKKFDNQENIYYIFEYDGDNKLVYAEKYKNDSLLLKARYTYDGLGRRIEKKITEGSIVTRKSYIYDGDNILLEYNTSGATPIEVARYIGTGEIDDNLMVIKNGRGYFYHKDHLGSVVAVTNDAGEVVQKNQYSSFGKILSIKDKNRKEIGLQGAVEKSFAYTGREWDEEIDLYYYRNRSYDPEAGRFIQKDPIGLAAGDTNSYRYVKNNSLRFYDPFGLSEEDAINFWKMAMAEFPGVKTVPYIIFVDSSDFKGSSFFMGTNILLLQSKYEKDLSNDPETLKELMTTIFHEAQHFQQGYLYTAAATSNNHSTMIKGIEDWHYEIDQNAKELTKKYWTPCEGEGK